MRKEEAIFIKKENITPLFVKHTALQQQHADYVATADYNHVKWHSGLGYLPLLVTIPLETIQLELQAVKSHMKDIADLYTPGWLNFSMYAPTELETGDSYWHPLALELMPETIRWFKSEWPAKSFYRMRMLGLAPGGQLGVHHDDCDGLDNINIGIEHPEGCDFYLENSGIIPFANGRVFALDAGRRHAVINNSSTVRYHLTIYQEDDQRFKDLMVKSYHEYFKNT